MTALQIALSKNMAPHFSLFSSYFSQKNKYLFNLSQSPKTQQHEPVSDLGLAHPISNADDPLTLLSYLIYEWSLSAQRVRHY